MNKKSPSFLEIFIKIRQSLFSHPKDIVISLVCLFLIYKVSFFVLNWAVFEATWVGTDRSFCDKNSGACWIFIIQKINQFIYGFYPKDQIWRPNLAFLLFFIIFSVVFIKNSVHRLNFIFIFLIIYPIVSYLLIAGDFLGLVPVENTKWGGLMLTLIVAYLGVIFSFPLGLLFALGRQSKMPVIKFASISYIEFLRGVPLITILFMSSVVFPLFVPTGFDMDKLFRALIAVILFQAVYVAEIVRGGLQAIPKSQYEASDSLGLNYFQKTYLIILPQALKISIPNLVGASISLVKDTTLVLIIGLFDLLGIVAAVTSDSKWIGFQREGYFFAFLIFWVICFSLSKFSLHLEKKTGIPKRV